MTIKETCKLCGGLRVIHYMPTRSADLTFPNEGSAFKEHELKTMVEKCPCQKETCKWYFREGVQHYTGQKEPYYDTACSKIWVCSEKYEGVLFDYCAYCGKTIEEVKDA